MTNPSKFLNSLVAAILGVAVAVGLFWFLRPVREAGANQKASSESRTRPAISNQAQTERTGEGKPSHAPVKTSRAYTSDELVAIYESEGAAAALAAAKSMKEPERASQVLFVLSYLARIDPEYVAGELKEAGMGHVHQGFVVDAVMADWKDGKKALVWATSNFTGDLLKKATGGALRILAKTDPGAALAHLETLPDGGSRDQAISDIFVEWGRCDPQAALKVIGENFSADDRTSAIRCVIAGWTYLHTKEAAAWVESVQDEELRTKLLSEVTRTWKLKSPEEAAAWVESLPEGPGKEAGKAVMQEPVHVIRCGFNTEGPDLSWKTKTIATMEDKDFRNWAYQDPDGARKFLETAPEGKDLGELASTVANVMSSKIGPEAAFDWAQTLQGEARKDALRLAVAALTSKDPMNAAKHVESIEPNEREPLSTLLVDNWTRMNPAAAAAWVATYDGAEQKKLVREVLSLWTDSQPREAYVWLGNLPMGASRDEGIELLLRWEARKDPESVVPWIELLSDPKLRVKMKFELEGYLKEKRGEK